MKIQNLYLALSPRNFEELKNNEFPLELLDCFNWNFVADYGRVLGKPELFRLGDYNLMGYYTIDNESIIYHPMKTKEYTRIFSGVEYFTQHDLSQLLYEELNQHEKRNLFLDLEENETFEKTSYEQVNKDQLIEYALNPDAGRQLVKRRKK